MSESPGPISWHLLTLSEWPHPACLWAEERERRRKSLLLINGSQRRGVWGPCGDEAGLHSHGWATHCKQWQDRTGPAFPGRNAAWRRTCGKALLAGTLSTSQSFQQKKKKKLLLVSPPVKWSEWEAQSVTQVGGASCCQMGGDPEVAVKLPVPAVCKYRLVFLIVFCSYCIVYF